MPRTDQAAPGLEQEPDPEAPSLGEVPGLAESRQDALLKTGAAAPRSGKKPHEGHRDRLKRRFHETAGAGFRDDELLELLLYLAFPRRDTKPIARGLIARFGSFGAAIAAPHARLREVEGIGESAATHIAAIAEAGRRLALGAVDRRAPLSSWSALVQYCHAAMAFQDVECFRILFLDKRNGLIRDEEQQRGTVDHTPVYAREVVKRALELSATALILVHNHPSGDVTPSQADIQITREIIAVAKPLGIQVHDHVIVGRHGEASLRGLGLI